MKSSKYKPLQCGNGVLVKFYGDLDPLFIPWMDLPLSVEEICEKAAQHLSKYLPRGNLEKGVCHMTSLTLPMYGLIDLEHKIWTSPREKLTKLESVYHFVFRIRFCIYSSQLHQLQKLDHQTWEYLYLQLHDDFLNGRFETMYRKVLSRPKLLGFVVVGYFIPKLNNQESSSQSQDSENSAVREQMKMPQVTFFGLKHHLPRNERLVFRWPWPYFRLHRSVKETVRKYFNSLEMIEFSSNRFKYTFMNGILEEVGRYGSEEYTAMEVVVSEGGGTKHEEIDILVDPFMSRPSGISFGTNYISSIQDIQNIVLQTSANPDYQGRVQIDRKGTPKTVLFKDAKVAQSFVSCVDGYRRLRCNFYYSLSSQASVEAPSLTTLNEMRAFGPLLKADAERELQRQIIAGDEEGLNRKSAIFLIHQSTESLFDFVIVKMTAPDETPSHTKMKYNPKSGIYSTDLEDVGAVESKNIGDILRVLKKDARMIRPSSDCSLTEFFRCDEMEYYYQRGNPVSTTRSSEPRLYHEESLHIEESIIGQGQFTQVSSGSLYNQDDKEDQNFLVAIKQLKPDERKYFENFQSGMCRLAKLQYYKVFVRLYGYMMGPPIRAVMEYASLGDLQSVMINCPHPLTVLQILSAIEHLTHGLIAMEERKEMHGNLRCRNLLVSQMTSNSLLVRIGDPGMESLYNTRPLSDPVNLERLPWVAVERFSNLSKVTLESEIYSFATTCWEMLSKGAHPKDFIHEDITKFYTLGKHLPCPKGLAVVPDDNFKELKETLWKLMKKCWNSDPNERPSMKEIQRSVYSLSDAVKEQDNIASPEDWEKNAKFLKDRHKNTMNASYTFNEHVVINQSQLEIDKSDDGKLGEGYYGEVRKAKLYENSNKLNHRSSKFTTVAVKTTKKVHKDQTFQFLQEIELASKLQHRNIVTVIGVCCLPTHQLVMEFVDRGCLQKYIQKNSSIPTMAKFCLDVAEGMKYLHSRNVLHRDLAARNVLLTKDLTAKITDFGLSRVLLDKDYYRGNTNKQIPLHWCSPEAVCRLIFTKKGDVWSYGVLMWEIFSQGSRPHLVEECDQRKLKDKLEAGVRLRRPEKCPEEFYKIMKEMCWKYEPSERPDFQFIAFKVDEISKNLAEKKEPTE